MEPQQVVLGEAEATDWRVGFQATMWPMPIVAMEPIGQFSGSLIRVLISTGISPFAKRGLDEAFCFAIGLGRVGPGEDLTQAKTFAGCSERL